MTDARLPRKIRHLDLFSGLGINTLAAKLAWGGAHESVMFCDIEPFAQAILARRFPDVPVHGDIRTLDAARHRVDQLKACGNSIQVQIALEIFKAIKSSDELQDQ
jgi:site-specific DNA-cytosine methylase